MKINGIYYNYETILYVLKLLNTKKIKLSLIIYRNKWDNKNMTLYETVWKSTNIIEKYKNQWTSIWINETI